MFEPEGEQFAWAHHWEPGALDVRVENPGLRRPLTFILDDPSPLRNPMFFHGGFRGDVEVVPNSFAASFADVVERTGLRGKFSVVPYPFGLGRIDRGLQGVRAADLDEFLAIVRERVAPGFDITPEVLTHWNALDLATERLLPLWEHEWSRRQTRETLTPYIALGLEILNNVGLPANGVTSPWNFGHGVEDEYVPAILEAQQRVNGIDLTWYFLDYDRVSVHVPPRVMHLDGARATAVVSIIDCDLLDFAWLTQRGEPAAIDALIDASGTGGRIVDLARAGGPIAFGSHWQSLFSNGTATGLAGLEEVANRVATHLGDHVRWMTCSELARIAATAAAVAVGDASASGQTASQHLEVTSPFACPSFTISLAKLHVDLQDVRTISASGRALARSQAPGTAPRLNPGTWTVHDGRLYVCWDLQAGTTGLTIATH